MFNSGCPFGELLSGFDAIMAMVRDGKKLFDSKGNIHLWTGYDFVKVDSETHESVISYQFYDLFRRPENRKRKMMEREILTWKHGEESNGWWVRSGYSRWVLPRGSDCEAYGGAGFQRARRLPDDSAIDWSTLQGFEVAE
jgi:hypothetical protein